MAFDLKVGFSCNNNCVHCVITDKSPYGDLSTEEIMSLIKNDVRPGEDIILTGGEPTIRKDFLDIIKFIKENTNGKLILQTNGRKFQNIEFAKKTLEYVDVFLIAIHSNNSLDHDKITEEKGSHRQTVEGAFNIVNNKSERHSIISQTVISKYNYKNLLGTFDLIHELGIREMYMTFPHPMGNSWSNFDEVVPQYIEIKDEIHSCLAKYGKIMSTEAIPMCYVHPYVDITRFAYERENDIANRGFDASNENGVVEDYGELLYGEFRKVPECKECIYDNRCVGVWKEYYEKYKDKMDLVPIKE